ncbi:hypothetical protein B0H13DRAFT_1873730 [Mycena leptocephala]|nr:hypothetical protein B0H13DRAFT_1873730 [Mycena leptocephala]
MFLFLDTYVTTAVAQLNTPFGWFVSGFPPPVKRSRPARASSPSFRRCGFEWCGDAASTTYDGLNAEFKDYNVVTYFLESLELRRVSILSRARSRIPRAPRGLVYRPVTVRPALREAGVADGRRERAELHLGPAEDPSSSADWQEEEEERVELSRGAVSLCCGEGKGRRARSRGLWCAGGETRRFGAARGPHKGRAHGAPDARGADPATTPHPAAYPARAWEELSSKRGARLSSGARHWVEWGALWRCGVRVGAPRGCGVSGGGEGLLTARARFGTARPAAAALYAGKGRFAGRAAKADGPSVLHTPVHLRGVGRALCLRGDAAVPPHSRRPPQRGCRAMGGR